MGKNICKETMKGREKIQKKSPKFECKSCGELAPSDKNLCKPKKIKGS